MSTTSLVKSNGNHEVTISTVNEISSLAEAFHKSGMFSDIKSAAQAIVKIQAGAELGLPPVYSMQRLYMVQGKLGMSAETMGALIKRSGKYDYKVTEHTDTSCTVTFYQGDRQVYTSTFTIEDARRAKLITAGGSWEKYPRAMLYSRALSQGARIVAPECIGGAYTEEELRSIPEMPAAELPSIEAPVTEVEYCSEQQRRKIFASLNEYNISEGVLKEYIWKHYAQSSTKLLTKEQASEIINIIETNKSLE